MGDYITASKEAYKASNSLFNSNSYSSFETSYSPFVSTSNFASYSAPTSIDIINSYSLLYTPKTKATEDYNSKAKSYKGRDNRGSGHTY
jgi:hypothetical protein